MEKTRDETKALEQAIQDSAALMQRPGWLKSAHEERRKQALAVVQTHEKGEADRGAHETAAQGEQEGWKGTDEEILKAQHTIERLEEKIRRLRERCDAAFMSEGTRAAIVNEIQKSAEMKDNLENKVSKTMHHRADQRRRPGREPGTPRATPPPPTRHLPSTQASRISCRATRCASSSTTPRRGIDQPHRSGPPAC